LGLAGSRVEYPASFASGDVGAARWTAPVPRGDSLVAELAFFHDAISTKGRAIIVVSIIAAKDTAAVIVLALSWRWICALHRKYLAVGLVFGIGNY